MFQQYSQFDQHRVVHTLISLPDNVYWVFAPYAIDIPFDMEGFGIDLVIRWNSVVDCRYIDYLRNG
jgi:hypothetical protein